MKRKTIFGIIIFAVFLGVAYFAYNDLAANYKSNQEIQQEDQASDQPSNNEKKKNQAPDFTVFDNQGNKVKLSDFIGKPVVLNFWASWCPPCRGEMPHFNEVSSNVKNDVVFMMVDLVDGQRETQAKGQKYVEEQGYDFPVYFDNEQKAANTYGISSIPTTFIIDAEGNIVNAFQGAIDKQTLQKAINLLMKQSLMLSPATLSK